MDADLKLLKAMSNKVLLWTLVVGTVVLLFFVVKDATGRKQVGNGIVGVVVFVLPFFFVLKPLFLSAFLLLNVLGNEKTQKQYAVAFFIEEDKKSPMLYDVATNKIVSNNIQGLDKVAKQNTGDIVMVTFYKGMLGYNFDPRIQ